MFAPSRFFTRLVAQDRWLSFVLLTAPLTWLLAVAVVLPWLLAAHPGPPPERSGWWGVFSGLVFAPVLENLIMVAILAVARNRYSDRASVAIMVGVAAVAHALISPWVAIAASFAFAIYGISYVWWHASGAPRAYWITVLQHAIFNLPATLIGALAA